MDPSLISATELVQLIQERQLSAAEVLESVLARYERHNPAVNAVILTRIVEARRQAKAVDEALATGEPVGALHGVPMTIKESFDWVDTPTTLGIPALTHNNPKKNAVAVDQLLGAGAVIYGKTNVPMHLADSQSFNDIYGTTNNPWALDRTPGGSSGGSAAAIATSMATLELGSDQAGSGRNPAHYCGVFSHKPTYGLVSLTGHGQPGTFAAPDIMVATPLARTAADLDLAMQVLAPNEWAIAGAGPLDKRELSDYRAAIMLESPYISQDPVLTERFNAAVATLVKAGLSVEHDAIPDIDLGRVLEVHLLLLRAATGAPKSDYAVARFPEEVARYDAGARDRRALEAKGAMLSHREWYALHNEREKERLGWAAFFKDYDVLLCPTSWSAAYPHNHADDRFDTTERIDNPTRNERYFWPLLPAGVYLPSTVVPVGLTASGLPCGLQVVAPHGRDGIGIAFAKLMEKALGGYARPPMLA